MGLPSGVTCASQVTNMWETLIQISVFLRLFENFHNKKFKKSKYPEYEDKAPYF